VLWNVVTIGNSITQIKSPVVPVRGTGRGKRFMRSGHPGPRKRALPKKLADEFVCELMREFADVRVGRRRRGLNEDGLGG